MVLSKVYSYNVIPAKYRTFTAAMTFSEYFMNGRVDNLKEAINLFEQEVRQNLIIENLASINQSITELGSDILRGQGAIYNAINDTNYSIQQMSSEIVNLSNSYVQNSNRNQQLLEKTVENSKTISDNSTAIKESLKWVELYHYYFNK